MIRKRISYVEDSISAPSQESLLKIKPFLITRKRISRVVKKTLRNKCKNWIEDYMAEKKDSEIFSEILSNKLQKPLSLVLKKTYPLSLCEIRVLEIIRPLKESEIPKITKKEPSKEDEKGKPEKIEQGLDQLAEIEQEKIEKAEKEIKKTQEKATKKQEIEKGDEKEEIKNKKVKDKATEKEKKK